MNDKVERPTLMEKILAWRESHISERMFVLILAFCVGFFSAVAASNATFLR